MSSLVASSPATRLPGDSRCISNNVTPPCYRTTAEASRRAYRGHSIKRQRRWLSAVSWNKLTRVLTASQLKQRRDNNPILRRLHQRLKNKEAHAGGLQKKENRVKLMVALTARDSGSHQACEIKHAADEICRSQRQKMRHTF